MTSIESPKKASCKVLARTTVSHLENSFRWLALVSNVLRGDSRGLCGHGDRGWRTRTDRHTDTSADRLIPPYNETGADTRPSSQTKKAQTHGQTARQSDTRRLTRTHPSRLPSILTLTEMRGVSVWLFLYAPQVRALDAAGRALVLGVYT